MSILLATISIGFVIFRILVARARSCWSFQFSGFSGSSFSSLIALFTISSVTFSPLSCFARALAGSWFSVFTCLANFSHPFVSSPVIHKSSSTSRNLMSNAGSCVPGSLGSPFSVVLPLMSTTCMNASACRKSSRNLFPMPFPSWAPGTSPATSITSTGTNLVSPLMNPVLGVLTTPNSGPASFTLTNPNPLFGSIVANG